VPKKNRIDLDQVDARKTLIQALSPPQYALRTMAKCAMLRAYFEPLMTGFTNPMKSAKLTVAVLLLLAGCATTPKELMDDGERADRATKRAPEMALGCMARNIESGFPMFGITRPLDDGRYELLVRNSPDLIFVYAVAEPVPEGSNVTIWVRKQAFYRKSEILGTMTKGC
jgi:hypothetical protein